MSNRRNLANAILKDPVNDSTTTWELEAGYGDAMPPAVPYHLTATPFGQLSTLGNSEVVLVTARTLDTLTVVRGQKGTTAQPFLAGAVISNGIMVDDVIGTEVTVATAAATAAKVGTTTDGNYTPVLGDRIIVTFVNGSNVDTPTLNIDGSGAKNIRLGQTNANTLTMGLGTAAGSNVKKQMWYDGTYWQLYGANDNTSTTYSEITEAEIDAGTASTARTISGRRSLYIINKAIAGAVSAVQALTNWVTTAMLQDGSVTSDKIDFTTLKLIGMVTRGNVANDNTAINDDNWRAVRDTADTADLSLAIECSGVPVIVDVAMVIWSNQNQYKNVRVLLDGTPVGDTMPMSYLINGVAPGALSVEFTPTAGSHTLTFQWQRDGGASSTVSYRSFVAKVFEVVGGTP